jgi:transmembrane sensor
MGVVQGLNEQVALQAARGFLLLTSGEATAAEQTHWQHWRQADPAHEIAWQRAELVSHKFQLLPAALAKPVLGRAVRASVNRRATIKTLAVLLTATPAGWLAWRASPASEWSADLRTATGEQREFQLADGSRILLDTASAVDIKFDSGLRKIYLRSGAILITTAPDPAAQRRPFVVETAEGRLRALGTRFSVRQDQARTQVAVFEGAVEVRPAQASAPPVVLQAGEQTSFTASRVDGVKTNGPHAEDWSRGVLYASNMRLQDFANELARYRPGILRCDPDVAELRISGVFQLRNTTPVLDSLPQALPVDVLYRTRYWVTLLAPGS